MRTHIVAYIWHLACRLHASSKALPRKVTAPTAWPGTYIYICTYIYIEKWRRPQRHQVPICTYSHTLITFFCKNKSAGAHSVTRYLLVYLLVVYIYILLVVYIYLYVCSTYMYVYQYYISEYIHTIYLSMCIYTYSIYILYMYIHTIYLRVYMSVYSMTLYACRYI